MAPMPKQCSHSKSGERDKQHRRTNRHTNKQRDLHTKKKHAGTGERWVGNTRANSSVLQSKVRLAICVLLGGQGCVAV